MTKASVGRAVAAVLILPFLLAFAVIAFSIFSALAWVVWSWFGVDLVPNTYDGNKTELGEWAWIWGYGAATLLIGGALLGIAVKWEDWRDWRSDFAEFRRSRRNGLGE